MPFEPELPHKIESEHITLRLLSEADTQSLHFIFTDPAAMKYWDLPPAKDIRDTAAWIQKSHEVSPIWHAAWVVCERESNQVIGLANYLNREPWNQTAEIGVIFSQNVWGRGFAYSCLKTLLPVLFQSLCLWRLEARVRPENVRCLRLLHRLHFIEEGLLRGRLLVNGQHHDIQIFSLLKPDWESTEGKIDLTFRERSEMHWRGDDSTFLEHHDERD